MNLSRHQELIDRWVAQELNKTSLLHQVALYAFEGGKRFRSALILEIGEALGQTTELLKAPAVAVEAFHTASLIADDFPSMDDALERRGRITAHCKFGLPQALLASYSLIAFGYEMLCESAIDPKRIVLAIKESSKMLGFEGTCLGQLLDLTMQDTKQLEEMILLKTGTLFELSFVLSWIYANQPLEVLPFVKRTAQHFGMAFQIADDLFDIEEDSECKNFAKSLGKSQAYARIELELEKMEEGLKQMGVSSLKFKELITTYLHQKA